MSEDKHGPDPVVHGSPREPLDSAGHEVRDEASGLPILPGAGELAQRANRTLWGDAWRRLRKNKLAVIGLIWVVFIVAMTVSADLWVPRYFADPTSVQYEGLQSPSSAHPFGTDVVGRDVFSRVIYGARISLAVGILAVGISLSLIHI